MENNDNIIPNTVTFVYENADNYTFFLNFKGGEKYKDIVDRLSNPLKWDSIFVASDDAQLHFINLRKVRHVYFSVISEERQKEYLEKPFKNIAIATNIGFGVLVPEGPHVTGRRRIADIPSGVSKKK